jgi:type VI protein secretion system component VasF
MYRFQTLVSISTCATTAGLETKHCNNVAAAQREGYERIDVKALIDAARNNLSTVQELRREVAEANTKSSMVGPRGHLTPP